MKRKDIDLLMLNSLAQILQNQNDKTSIVSDIYKVINKLAEPAPKKEAKTKSDRINDFRVEFNRAIFKESAYIKNKTIGFLEYWLESTSEKSKMRFEKEKVFDMKRRINTWINNNEKFSKDKSGNTTEGFEEFKSIFNN